MFTGSEMQAYLEALREKTCFEDTEIVMAYPYTPQPTRLASKVLAVSVGEVRCPLREIGGTARQIFCTVQYDIYVPEKMGLAPLLDLQIATLACAAEYGAVEMRVGKTAAVHELHCLHARCEAVFQY